MRPRRIGPLSLLLLIMASCSSIPNRLSENAAPLSPGSERQVTRGPGGRILTNTGVWSPDGQWIVYDTRPDEAGAVFEGETIEMVNINTSEIKQLYKSRNGARCGVATFHPCEWKVAFILGPEHPSPDWQYCAWHRRGVIVDASQPGKTTNLDARDITPPFTPGALRGGSHVHVWDSLGEWVSFTYEDHTLAQFKNPTLQNDVNLRNIGVSIPGIPVRVSRDHPRNHDGDYFTVLATRTTATPEPGSDQISRAFEEAWVGTNGYVRPHGSRQKHALAFQGQVLTKQGSSIAEVFIVDLPEDLTIPGDGPLCGTETRAPCPPKGTVQRRLTFTGSRQFPGVQGPRHWLRSSPDGSKIAFLMRDAAGIVQIFTVSPNGGTIWQLTCNPWPISSAFTWSPEGRYIAHVADNSVCITDADSGETKRLTPRTDDATAPRPEACVFSPDGKKIAFVRRLASDDQTANQICVVGVGEY